jgi:hypothetical protein
MIVRLYIGEDPYPLVPEDFDVTDSKEAASLFEQTIESAAVGEAIRVIVLVDEAGP